jgi:hypothetical protein
MKIGSIVKCTYKIGKDYNIEGETQRIKFSNKIGKVIKEHNSHGECYTIQFAKGEAVFDPDELEEINPPENYCFITENDILTRDDMWFDKHTNKWLFLTENANCFIGLTLKEANELLDSYCYVFARKKENKTQTIEKPTEIILNVTVKAPDGYYILKDLNSFIEKEDKCSQYPFKEWKECNIYYKERISKLTSYIFARKIHKTKYILEILKEQFCGKRCIIDNQIYIINDITIGGNYEFICKIQNGKSYNDVYMSMLNIID